MKRILTLIISLTTMMVAMAQETSLPEGWSPCSVLDIEATVQEEGDHMNVVISFTTPSEMEDLDWNRAPLAAPISKIVISRNEVGNWLGAIDVGLINNPEAGIPFTFTDAYVPYGSYDYSVTVYVGESASFPEIITGLSVGEFAIPGEITGEVSGRTVTLTIAPATMNSSGEELSTPVLSLQVGELDSRNGEVNVVGTVESPSATESTVYTISDVADGSHTYAVRLSTYAGYGEWAYLMDNIYVGQDLPGMVENIQVGTNEKGEYVVSWEAPSAGLNGGDQGDLTQMTYTVKRGANEYDLNAVTIAEATHDLTVVDPVVFTEETSFCYIITATNGSGDGYPVCSDMIVAGPAATLPFTENFDTPMEDMWTTYDHASWERTSTGFFPAWNIGSTSFVDGTDVSPHNGAGLLYAYYGFGSVSCTDDITSGRINFSEAIAPSLTFWYYDVAAEAPSCVEFSVEVSADGENFTATSFSHTMGTAPTTGWHQAIVPLTALAGAPEGRVRFHNVVGEGTMLPVTIDEISIADSSAESIAPHLSPLSTPLSAPYDLQGRRLQKVVKGITIQNGEKVMR